MEDLLAVFLSITKPKKSIIFFLGDEDEDEDVVTLPPTNEWD
jgi:hypothetical protein